MRLLTLSACLPGMLLTMLLLARGVTWLLPDPLRRNLPRDLGHRGGLHTGDRSHPV